MSKSLYEIDGRDFSTLQEFYEVISRLLWSDCSVTTNLDSFNSRLGESPGPCEFILRWKNSDLSRRRLSYPETVRQLERRLTYCHPLSRDRVSEDLKRAEDGGGP